MEIGDRALNRFYSDLGDGRSDMGDNSRRISTYSSDADKIITAASSESNESSNANNVEEEVEERPKTAKWRSAWDLTEREKEKLAEKKEKKLKKKRKRTMISQGLLDLITIGDPAVSSDNHHIRSFVNKAFKNPPQPVATTAATAATLTAPMATQEADKDIPPLPIGKDTKTVLDVTLDMDVDRAFKTIYEDDSFFERLSTKVYGECNDFRVTSWTKDEDSENQSRKMSYTFPKSLAITKYTISVDQAQTRLSWSTPGLAYGVNTVNRSSGAPYADYFFVETHTRFEKVRGENKTKVTILGNLTWEKQCFLRSKIESESWSNMRKFYDEYEQELTAKKTTKAEKATNNESSKTTANGGTAKRAAPKQPLLELTSQQKRSSFSFDETTVLIAFILVITTLLIITLAMFKLAGSIASLSDRLANLEEILTQNSPCLVRGLEQT